MKINNATLNQFRQDFQDAVKDLEKKYGVVIEAKKITYDDISFSFKVEVNNGASKEDVSRKNFDKYCDKYFLEPGDYKMHFTAQGKEYEIYDVSPSKPKYPIAIKEIESGKTFNCTVEFIPELRKRKQAWYEKLYKEIEEPTHKCKYCGHETPGADEDVLCDDCQELFGHKHYSKL